MNKYYTPEIEEFVYGLKYEMKPSNAGWEESREFIYPESIHDLIHLHGPNALEPYINKERIRVKYLDREDIESFGFKETNIIQSRGDNYKYKNCFLYYRKEDNRIIIGLKSVGDISTIFSGVIKNKSELKKLLKQLKISS